MHRTIRCEPSSPKWVQILAFLLRILPRFLCRASIPCALFPSHSPAPPSPRAAPLACGPRPAHVWPSLLSATTAVGTAHRSIRSVSSKASIERASSTSLMCCWMLMLSVRSTSTIKIGNCKSVTFFTYANWDLWCSELPFYNFYTELSFYDVIRFCFILH